MGVGQAGRDSPHVASWAAAGDGITTAPGQRRGDSLAHLDSVTAAERHPGSRAATVMCGGMGASSTTAEP